jgi:hypothetical protein
MSDNNKILIPKFEEAKPFYDGELHKALANCQSEGFDAQFIPEIMDSRAISYKGNGVWENWYSAPSIKATGTTKNGSKVVVYAHITNYNSNPENIKKQLSNLRNGAGILPDEEFHRLIALEDGERVTVLDYNIALKENKTMGVDKALENKVVVAFIGGKARTEKYLAQHKKVVGNNITIYNADDMDDVTRVRLLFVDYRYGNGYLIGDDSLYIAGRFLGVRLGAEGANAQKTSPLETLAAKGRDAGNGVIVINKNDITEEAYNQVTGKYIVN